MEQTLVVYGICPSVTLSIAEVNAQAGLILLLNEILYIQGMDIMEAILHGASPHFMSKTNIKFYVPKTVPDYLPYNCGQCLPPG